MKFGLVEIKEFAENHEDERVRIMYRRLCEARSKSAKWCDSLAKAEKEIEKLKEENETLRINRQKNVYKKYKDGLQEYRINTLCINCNGVGYHTVAIKDNNKVPYTQYGYMTCEMCNGQGSL